MADLPLLLLRVALAAYVAGAVAGRLGLRAARAARLGACGCSGGIFGRNDVTCGAVDAVLPVDAHIPGCPPNPYALLHGILLAAGRLPRAD